MNSAARIDTIGVSGRGRRFPRSILKKRTRLMQETHQEEKSGKKRYFVYILECADHTLYTGYTTDLNRRLGAHNAGKGAKYTRARRPVRLVYQEDFPEKGQALSREAVIKTFTRAQKLALIEEGRKSTDVENEYRKDR